MQPRSYANPASHAADAIQDVYEKIHKDHIQPNDDSDAALRDPHNILTILKSKSMRSRL